MFREVITMSATLLVVAGCPFAAQAAAADADQVIQIQDGTVRCLLSADYMGRGYAMTICGLADGQLFGSSPKATTQRLNLAVVHGTGEFYWETGPTPSSPTGEVAVGVGQTYRADGWTVTSDDYRTRIQNDSSGHGLLINDVVVVQF